MFENASIDTADLPKASHVEWRPLDHGFRRQGMLVGGIIAVTIGLALVIVQNVAGPAAAGDHAAAKLQFSAYAWLLWVPLATFLVAWPLISFPYHGYAVRERDILVRSGVFWRRVTAVPYNRIQHVETESSVLDRRFGISNLKLYTAGGSSGDLRIRGLAAAVSDDIRVFVLERIGAAVEVG